MSHPDFIFMLTRNDRTVAEPPSIWKPRWRPACATLASRTSASRWKSWRG